MKLFSLFAGILFATTTFASTLSFDCRNNLFTVSGLLEKDSTKDTQVLQGLLKITNLTDSRSPLNGQMTATGEYNQYPAGSFYKDPTTLILLQATHNQVRIFVKIVNQNGNLYLNGQGQAMTCQIRE